MHGRPSTSPAGVSPSRNRGGGRSLQVRFAALLIALAALAVAPLVVSAVARHSIDGLARTLDFTGSLRYRMRDIRRDIAANDSTHVREHLGIERQTLQELIDGDIRDGVPPCETPELCARLRAHQAHLARLAPALERSLARHSGTTLEVADGIRVELERLDRTVALTTDLMQQRAAAITGLGTVAGSASLALVLVIGLGVWDVFGRVRRLHGAVVSRSEEGLRAEVTGEHELALLARALADGLQASNAKRESDRRRVIELRAEQDAVRFAAERLNAWIAGAGDLAPALQRIAEAAGLGNLRFEDTASSSTVDAEFVSDDDLVLPLAWRDEYMGALRASGEDVSPEKQALLGTFAQLLTLASLSRRVLSEREHRGEIASALASIGAIRPGPSELGSLLDRLVAHDGAWLDVLDDVRRPQDRFRISSSSIERATTPATLDVPDSAEVRTRAGASAPGADAVTGDVLTVPLQVSGHSVGVLSLARAHDGFSRQERETASAIAPVVASALLRMRLTERLRISEQWTTIGAFGRMLADQLRNPLNNMKLQLHLVERRLRRMPQPVDGDGIVERMAVLTDEVERVNALLGEYLSMHPASGDQHHTTVDLSAVVGRVVDGARELLAGQNVSIVQRVSPGATVAGNAARLKQTIENLVENAVEAMRGRQDARLSVDLHERSDSWELVVRDNGPGITDPVAVFAPGYTTKPSGTGMGLALSLHTVLQHHGHLAARIPEDGGAEFTLSLPKCVCAVESGSAAM